MHNIDLRFHKCGSNEDDVKNQYMEDFSPANLYLHPNSQVEQEGGLEWETD